jgi:hypothetical protein
MACGARPAGLRPLAQIISKHTEPQLIKPLVNLEKGNLVSFFLTTAEPNYSVPGMLPRE